MVEDSASAVKKQATCLPAFSASYSYSNPSGEVMSDRKQGEVEELFFLSVLVFYLNSSELI